MERLFEMYKKIICYYFTLFIGLFCIGFITQESLAISVDVKVQNNASIIFNGNIQKLKKPVLYYRNTVMLPVKEVLNIAGINEDKGTLIWNPEESSLNIFHNEILFKIYNNKRNGYNGDYRTRLDYTPFIYDGSMYVSYKDIARNCGWVGIWEQSTRVVAICNYDFFYKNKELLSKTIVKLDSQPKLLVDISFDYDDENILFNFKIDNVNRIFNGSFLDTKTLENKIITEKSELFIKDENLFIKDYKINKWRLDETTNFDVATSFLRAFSSSYMLRFDDFAYSTFKFRETSRGFIFQNGIPFNDYMRKDMGFAASSMFNFLMYVDKDDYSISNIVVMNTSSYGQESQNSRMDISFGKYGSDVNIKIPERFEYADINVDDSRKINSIKKALTLFLFDADKEAFNIIENSKSVNELIVLLQKPIEIKLNDEIIKYGPYLSNVIGYGEPDATYYRPSQQDKKGLDISIIKKTKSVDVQLSLSDNLIIK
jgi:hypothetical protein